MGNNNLIKLSRFFFINNTHMHHTGIKLIYIKTRDSWFFDGSPCIFINVLIVLTIDVYQCTHSTSQVMSAELQVIKWPSQRSLCSYAR